MSFMGRMNGFPVGLGAGLVGGTPAWVPRGAVFHADYRNNHYWWNGAVYPTEAALLAAMGGTKSGEARTIGPYLTGMMLYQSDFSAGVDGWTDVPAFAAAGDPSMVGGNLRITATTTYKASKSIAVPSIKAAKCTANSVASSGLSSAVLTAGLEVVTGNGSVNTGNLLPTPKSLSVIAGSGASGLMMAIGSSGAGTIDISSVTAEEVLPFMGFLQGGFSFEVDVDFPASASGNKVLAQWGCDSDDFRVRLVWDASAVLRLIVTSGNSEQANLSLGTIVGGANHTIAASVAANAIYANLDGGVVLSDTSASMPPLGQLWIGRSGAGETFNGTFNRFAFYPTAKSSADALVDPQLGFRIFGDSTANGDGSTTDWYQNLTASYSPPRSYAKNAGSGETSAQMLARVAVDNSVYRRWTTIFMDLMDEYEPAATWLANVKAAVAYLQTDRWYVHPPVQRVPSTSIANITLVQEALLSDPFFAGHTLNASDQAAYITAMEDGATRSDGTHDSDAGAVIRATYIKAFLDRVSW